MGRQQITQGFTLVEVIISVALIGAGLLLVLSLIPSGVLSLKKAEDLQTATAYGLEVIEVTRSGLENTAHLAEFDVTLNNTDFHVRRQYYEVSNTDGRLHDVVVTIEWNAQSAPVQLSTRLSQPAAP